MADRYEDERRWRRRGEGRSAWDDESERDWQEYEWRNRPYSRREDPEYYREQDWRRRQGGEYGREAGRYGSGYGPGYDREFDREREWGRGRDWERGEGMMRGGGYGARPGRGFERDRERYGRGEQEWRGEQGSRQYGYGEQEWGRGRDWERDQGRMRGGYRGPYERDYDREGEWDYGRRQSGYGGGYGRGFDREQERFGRGQPGQYKRFRDMDEDYDWVEEEEPITTWTYTEYWYVPGPYAGIGPRDYSRSDERILEEVCERLTQHGQIDASDIEIEVQNGEVTLRGSVGDRREKRLAEDIADSIFGVGEVQNQLRTRERQLGRVEEIRHEPPGMTGQVGMAGERGRTGTGSETGMHRMSRDQIRKGMEVVGRDGERVGEVKEVRSNDFLVDRPMARDVYVPFSAGSMSAGRITLNVRADEVNDQNWETSELLTQEGGDQQSRNI